MPPLVFASITDFFLDPIVNAGTDFISSTGLPAVFVLMLLESACLPVPSEAIMLFAGASVAAGELSLFGVVAAGVLGNLVGSWIAYAIGYWLHRHYFRVVSEGHDNLPRRGGEPRVVGRAVQDTACEQGVDDSPILKSADLPLGASAGVAVSHVKFPVRHLLSEAEGLLKLAKQRVYKERGEVRSALDFSVITDGSPRAESVVPERLLEKPPAILRSGRPYSLDELETFSDRFRSVREARPGLGKSQLYALLRHFENGPAQLRSQILYQIGRRPEWQELVKNMGKREDVLANADLCVEAVVPKYGGKAVFDFADMLDLFGHWKEGEP